MIREAELRISARSCRLVSGAQRGRGHAYSSACMELQVRLDTTERCAGRAGECLLTYPRIAEPENPSLARASDVYLLAISSEPQRVFQAAANWNRDGFDVRPLMEHLLIGGEVVGKNIVREDETLWSY